jgi:uncharacterized membrane protein YwzB
MSQVKLRYVPQVREFQSKLAMLVLGAALIIFSTWFSIYVHFEPIVLSGDEWTFGPREVAHLIGFMGCVLTIWFCGNSFATRSTMLVSLSMGAVGIGLVVIAAFAPREIKDLFNPKAVEASLWVLYYYLVGCGAAWGIQKKISQWVFQPRRMLVITALLLALISIGWEVYTQPFEHVYQKPPRGYVQFAQVLCDFVGIAIGYTVVNRFIRRLEARGTANAPTPDCANTLAFAKELWALSTIGASQLKQRLMRSAQNV